MKFDTQKRESGFCLKTEQWFKFRIYSKMENLTLSWTLLSQEL